MLASALSNPSTSLVVSAYASRKSGSPKLAHWFPKPPTKPFAPAIPTLAPPTVRIACDRSRTITPASTSSRVRSAGRSDCQSWFPSTVTVGIESSRHASATTHASSTWPFWVRSPASTIRSARSSTRRKASPTRPSSGTLAWMSPAAATRIVFAGMRLYAQDWRSRTRVPRPGMASEANVGNLLDALKRAAAVLRDHDVDFALAGGFAVYARGGPETDHDVDFVLRRDDAEQALALLVEAGFRAERPPEGWLYKVCDDEGALIDPIFAPNNRPEEVAAILGRAG